MSATKYPEIFNALAEKFHPGDEKTRSQAGRTFTYITARTVMNRLDDVLGPENWWDRYRPSGQGENGILCYLTIRLPDGTTITKGDAGGFAGMQDSGDDEKSGYSDALKRAAVRFGIGRYLYRDGQVQHTTEEVPTAATPPPQARRDPEPTASAPSASEGGPKTGKQLFAWARDQDGKGEFQMLKYLTHWGKIQEYHPRMVEWDADQVATAYSEAQRRLRQVEHARAEQRQQAIDADNPPATAPVKRGSDVRERSAQDKFDERDPNTGKSLWTWIKHWEERRGIQGLMKAIQDWGKRRKLAARMDGWHASHVTEAVTEARRIIAAVMEERLHKNTRDTLPPPPDNLPAGHPWQEFRPARDEQITPRHAADANAFEQMRASLATSSEALSIEPREIALAYLKSLRRWSPAIIRCGDDVPDSDLVSCLAIARRRWPNAFESMQQQVLRSLKESLTNAR